MQTQRPGERKVPEAGVPVIGRRRIALFPGICGVGSRAVLTGEIVDVPILESHLHEAWSLHSNLPASLARRFRAIQDAGMNSVRGPRLKLEIIPFDESAPEHATPLGTIEDVCDRGNTVFRIRLFSEAEDPSRKGIPPLPPGRYLVRASLLGVESIRQHMTDLAYLGAGSNQFNQKDTVVGYAKLRLLPADYQGPVITSDIDQTFLDTQIDHRSGLLDALFEKIEAKRPLPGMDLFYRGVRSPGTPLFFISASPSFFRRTLEAVFERFRIDHDGLALKNLMGPIANIARKAFEIAAHIEDYMSQDMSEAMERSVKFLGSSYQSLLDQTSYKLTALLEQRLMLPGGAREILIGDNTESDFFIFSLYQALLNGALGAEEIEDFCYHLRFQGREAFTRDGARTIRRLVENNLEVHGPLSAVSAVWIHRARPEIGADEMRRSIEEGLPVNPEMMKRLVLPVAYDNAFELALLALNHELIEPHTAVAIAKDINGKRLRDHVIQTADLLSLLDRFDLKHEAIRGVLRDGLSLLA